MPVAQMTSVTWEYENDPTKAEVVERSNEYEVVCDCGQKRKMPAGGKAWVHQCPAFDPENLGREKRVTIEIDADGHMTTWVG